MSASSMSTSASSLPADLISPAADNQYKKIVGNSQNYNSYKCEKIHKE